MADFKLVVGDRYTNGMTPQYTTCDMTITKNPVANSVECKCNICGKVDTYKVSMLKNREVVICKSCKGNIELDKVYNGHLKAVGYAVYNKVIVFVVECINCNKKFFFTKEKLLDKKTCCVKCGTKNNIATDIEAKPEVKKEVKRIMPRSVARLRKEQEENEKKLKESKISGAIMRAESAPDPLAYKSAYDMKGSFLIRKTANRVSATGARSTEQFTATCMKCGASFKKTKAELNRMNYCCTECESRTRDGRNIFKNINWVGFVKNNLEVVSTVVNSEGGVTCKLKCLTCAKHVDDIKHAMIDNIPLVTLLDEKSEFICPFCADTILKVLCPLCGEAHIKTTTHKMYCNRDTNIGYKCTKIDKVVSREQILIYHETLASLDNLTSKYTNNYTLDCRIEGRGGFATILKFKEGYTGTDGNMYHTCMCAEHHKLLVLNDEEIRTYRHEYCADTRMMPYNPKIKPKE